MPRTKRKDKSRVVLRTGESQRADGTYHFSWTDANHKRRYVYAKTLDELRYKEEQIAKDKSDTPILSSSTVSDSRNIRQPSTKQFAVLFVTVTMSSC